MAKPTATIAEKLYVTIQYRSDTNNEDGLLGFASPYTKDAAFEKRKSTQDNWAYGHGVKVAIDEEDDCTVTGEGTCGGYGHGQKWDAAMLFMTNCYPRIMKNELVEGFEIAKSVRRSGWNGSGNVKWRITDPRGFDLEISSENFASVLACCTLVNGVIQGKCIWGRLGANNILLPEASEPYQEAASLTSKINNKISLKDINLGDIVELLSSKVAKDDLVCQYLGKYYFLESEQDGSTNYSNVSFSFNKKQIDRQLFKSVKTGKYFTVTTPIIIYVHNKLETPLNKEEVAREVTADLDCDNGIGDVRNVILVSATKIDLSKVVTTLEPINESFSEWPKVDKYQTDPIICEYENKMYIAAKGDKWNGNTREYIQEIAEIELNRIENKLRVLTKAKTDKTHWSTYTSYVKVSRSDFDFSNIKTYRMVVTAGDVAGRVYRLGYY